MLKRLLSMLIWCLSRLPETAAVALSRFFAQRLVGWKTEAARVTAINIRLCFPTMSAQDQQQMCVDSLAHSLLLLFEFAQLRFSEVPAIQSKIAEVDGAD